MHEQRLQTVEGYEVRGRYLAAEVGWTVFAPISEVDVLVRDGKFYDIQFYGVPFIIDHRVGNELKLLANEQELILRAIGVWTEAGRTTSLGGIG